MPKHVHIHLHDTLSESAVAQARQRYRELREQVSSLARAGALSTTQKLRLNELREKMRRLQFEFGAVIADNKKLS